VARNAEAVHSFVSCAAPKAALWVLRSVGGGRGFGVGDAAERLALHCSASDLFSRARKLEGVVSFPGVWDSLISQVWKLICELIP